jgi:hypothetical protein
MVDVLRLRKSKHEEVTLPSNSENFRRWLSWCSDVTLALNSEWTGRTSVVDFSGYLYVDLIGLSCWFLMSRLLTFPCHFIWTVDNQLTGSIPSELAELTSLTHLNLRTSIGLSCWHECHACSHFLAILFIR